MSKNNNTAETMVEIADTTDVATEDQADNEVEFSDNGKVDTKSTKQDKDVNAEYARKRREQERQAELSKARIDAIIDTLDGKNPYTGEEIVDEDDVQEYLEMKEMAKQGLDPLQDYAKYKKQKKKESKVNEQTQKKREEWLNNNLSDFMKKYPDKSINELLGNQAFSKFIKGRMYDTPMTELYEDFIEIVGSSEDKSKQMAKQIVANKNASVGSLADTGKAEQEYYTKEQVKKMTPAEVRKNYEQIIKSQKKWLKE